MLDFEKIGVSESRLVDLEGPHDSERGSTLHRPNELVGTVEEVRLARPMVQLGRTKEEATSVWIRTAVKLE